MDKKYFSLKFFLKDVQILLSRTFPKQIKVVDILRGIKIMLIMVICLQGILRGIIVLLEKHSEAVIFTFGAFVLPWLLLSMLILPFVWRLNFSKKRKIIILCLIVIIGILIQLIRCIFEGV